MSEHEYDGSTEVHDHNMQPTHDYDMQLTKKDLMSYVEKHREITNALGPPNSPTYNLAAVEQLELADKLYSSWLEGNNNIDKHGSGQKQIFIDALRMLDKVKEFIHPQ